MLTDAALLELFIAVAGDRGRRIVASHVVEVACRLPQAEFWITPRSLFRLAQGGNAKGNVPVHGKEGKTARIPLFTAAQMQVFADAYHSRCVETERTK